MILGAPAKAVRETDDESARHDRARGRRLCEALEALRRGAEAHRMNSGGRWQFFIDRGGTFTDIVARAPDGRLLTHKLLSENPEAYDGCGASPASPICSAPRAGDRFRRNRSQRSGWAPRSPPTRCSSARAIRVLLIVSQGFRDALEIGYQARPKIFARRIEKPSMLYARVAEVPERVRADGSDRDAARSFGDDSGASRRARRRHRGGRHRVHACLRLSRA